MKHTLLPPVAQDLLKAAGSACIKTRERPDEYAAAAQELDDAIREIQIRYPDRFH